ncbi:GNAT family N-acetyltransferase [Bacillus sp. JJ1773]|uniref:GNAT family N-acetyltransferase n=1 Tax=Bacillus sp. JJ1773 TaxID=3122965 RepID=UPI002FFFE695
MLNIEIRRPTAENIRELNHFFRVVITDTFSKEGIGEMLEDIEDEIEAKKKYLNLDFESDGEKRYFLIALDRDRIIGSIEFGQASELINHCTNHALKDLVEVGTVFVHPDFQRKGIGNRLLDAMFFTLLNKGIEEFCLDSGYTTAQKIWKKKFGEPQYLLKNYWGEGYDHMIWRINVKEFVK